LAVVVPLDDPLNVTVAPATQAEPLIEYCTAVAVKLATWLALRFVSVVEVGENV
jgi:hypothetical protein